MKTIHICQFTRHDLKKKFLSAATITKLEIWWGQFLLRYLVEPNKFCQPSAHGPLPRFVYLNDKTNSHMILETTRFDFKNGVFICYKALKDTIQ